MTDLELENFMFKSKVNNSDDRSIMLLILRSLYTTRHVLTDHELTIQTTKLIGDRKKVPLDTIESLEAAVQIEKDTMLFYYNLVIGLDSEVRQEVYKIIKVEHTKCKISPIGSTEKTQSIDRTPG